MIGHFTTDAGAFPLLDLQCRLAARLIDARRRAPERARGFEERERAARPDFTKGVRYAKGARRMANYVASRPYRRYLERAIEGIG